MPEFDRRNDRRRGPDLLTKSISWFAVGGWFIMAAALLFFGIAEPHAFTLFKQRFSIDIGIVRKSNLSIVLLFFMIAGLLLSGIGFYINTKRNRRRNDEYHLSLILIAMISILGIISYFLTK